MKTIVTGGAGFIGSHLIERLLNEGEEVTVYDNLSLVSSTDNIKQQMGKKNFQFVEEDLLNLDKVKKAMEGKDIVWHLGANTDIPGGNRNTDIDLKNCTIATWNVLEAMKTLGIKKILFTSSASVYGETPSVSLSETYGPLLPISLYAAGKLACEALVSAYSHIFGVEAWIFRFANVVGSRMNHGVIYDFIQKLRKNPKELEILGDGKQEKPFFMVEDCIEGMFHTFHNSQKQCDIYNLGPETFTQIDRIGQIVIEEMGLKSVKIKHTGGKRAWPGDVPVVHYNIEKAKKLGWKPRYSSDEAVRIAAQRILKQINYVKP